MAALGALVATTGAITVGLVAAPMAASAAPTCSAGTPVTSTYTSNQLGTYVVPAGVTQVVAVAAGGAGGSAPSTAAFTRPGDGAVVSSTLGVSPADSLSVSVGQVGTPGVGGESGGNPSGGGTSSNVGGPGGGGGGASFVTDGATLEIAAGGGGGAGYGGFGGSDGGNGSANAGPQTAGAIANGGNGQAGQANVLPGLGGGGGTATPGAAGATNPNYSGNAAPGSGVLGGEGSTPNGDGGGGGGGYAGGGGGGMGGYAGGGGAGSSYGIDAYNLSSNGGDGSVAISYEDPALTSTDAATWPAQQLGTFTVCTTALPTATIVETGALPTGVTFVDNGDGTATLSGLPASGTEGSYPMTFTAANGNGSDATQDFTLTVAQDTPDVSLSSEPVSSTFGDAVTFTAEVDGVPDGSAPTGTVAFQNDGASISPLCDAAVVSTTAGVSTATCPTSSLGGGTDPITATYSGDTDYVGGGNDMNDYVVATATPVVDLESSVDPSVFGQAVTATAAITPSDLAGSVQFSVNGTDLGSPVPVNVGSAQSPTLTDAGDPLSISDNTVAATFTPTDTPDYSTADDSIDQVVDLAGTTTAISVAPTTLTAVVAAVAPGAGTPTGTVTFSVDGTSVGTAPVAGGVATLSDTVPTGSTHDVSAVYSGDADFTTSSDSTSRVDPTITAALTSAHPKTTSGWYRSPVTVHFTCTTSGAPLTGPCPSAVTLTKSMGGQSVTRTIIATDGGAATVVVNSISIDRVKPHVVIHGVHRHGVYDGIAPTAHCIGTDALSGVDSCVITVVASAPSAKDIRTVHYAAVATDKAGNTATVHRSVRVLGLFVRSARFTGGAFNVKIGHDYTVGVVSKTRPRYIDATPAHGPRPTPFNKGPLMTNAGHGVWIVRIAITKSMHHHSLWHIGAKSGGTLRVVTIRLSS